MKANNPTGPSTKRDSNSLSRLPAEHRRAVILDFVQSRIESFNEQHGGGVGVRKDSRGYTLFRQDTKSPVARLRPKGTSDRFEVLYWSRHQERWRPVGSFGGMVLGLDDALEFIASDPMGCFWY
jgi:hypothetical protein